MKAKKRFTIWGNIVSLVIVAVIFIIPFAFMLINSLKERREANLLNITLPESLQWSNYVEAFSANNYQILTAFKNSLILTFFSILGLIIVGSMAGYVVQRRRDKKIKVINMLFTMGLMIPAAVMPTIWLLQHLHLYKTMFGLIMVEIALQIPFTIMLYRGFMASIPRELEEAAVIDGCSAFKMFTSVIFPLLRPVTATTIILNACSIFNDFANPLYFLPGKENVTVQLTLYSFMGQYTSSYNLLFADVIIITVPMLIIFIVFNKQLVEGLTAGAVKG
ncbi:MAG: carbohydrate ABC transporter permease [Suipraeoptans sp.]